jgi:hypothetical protein
VHAQLLRLHQVSALQRILAAAGCLPAAPLTTDPPSSSNTVPYASDSNTHTSCEYDGATRRARHPQGLKRDARAVLGLGAPRNSVCTSALPAKPERPHAPLSHMAHSTIEAGCHWKGSCMLWRVTFQTTGAPGILSAPCRAPP